MTDAALVFWTGTLCASLFWVAAGALVVLSIDRKLTERVADIERWQGELMKKLEAKK